MKPLALEVEIWTELLGLIKDTRRLINQFNENIESADNDTSLCSCVQELGDGCNFCQGSEFKKGGDL